MTQRLLIGVVSVLYNSGRVLPDFFQSLYAQSYEALRLYLVNNASPDTSLRAAEEFAENSPFPITIIDNDKNYGVAKANNQGIVAATNDKCPYVLLSNNDVVFGPETIGDLYSAMQDGTTDMIVPKILYYDTDMIWSAGGHMIPRYATTIQYGQKKKDDQAYNKRLTVNYAPTCFMLLKSDIFPDVGLMDENYFVYYDDTDFVYRALRRGRRLDYYPGAVVEHKESFCTGPDGDFKTYYLARNRVYFILKHFTPIPRIRSFVYLGYFYLIKSLAKVMLGRIGLRKWLLSLKALLEGFGLYKKVLYGTPRL